MQKGSTKLKVAILVQPFVVTMIAVPSVVLASIAASFPEAGRTGLQLIVSLGTLGMFIASLAAGAIASKIKRKTMSLAALAVILTGGILMFFFNDKIAHLYISNFICGCGAGLLLTNVTILNSTYFEGDERSKMLGYQSAMQNIGAVIIKLSVGAIGASYWLDGYYSFILVFIVALLVMILLPKDKTISQAKASKTEEKTPLPMRVWILCLISLISMACSLGYTYNISLYNANYAISSPQFIAVMLSVLTGLAAVAGFAFPHILKIAKGYTISVALVVSATGYLLLALLPSAAAIVVATVFIGFGYGMIAPAFISAVMGDVTQQQASRASGIVIACISIGGALTPFIFNPLANMFPRADESTIFLLCGSGFVILTLLTALWNKGKKGTETSKTANEVNMAE